MSLARSNQTSIRIALAVPLLAASFGLIPMAHASTPTGVIRVTEASGSSGWAYSVASDDPTNCPIPSGTPTSATTNGSGIAEFSGLQVEDSSGTACTYTITETVQTGYEQVTPATALTGLTAGTLVPATTSGVGLTAVSGVLTNASRSDGQAPGCLVGAGTSQMTAGYHWLTGAPTCASAGSGVSLSGTPVSQLPLGSTQVATVTHINNTIQQGYRFADATLTMTFKNLADNTVQTVTAAFGLDIDETRDNPANGVCKYETATTLNHNLPFGYGCADRFSITPPATGNSQVVVGGTTINLGLALVPYTNGSCEPGAAPVDYAYTAEGLQTPFCLVALITADPTVTPTTVTVENRRLPSPTPSASATATVSSTPTATAPASSTASSSPSTVTVVTLPDTGSDGHVAVLAGGVIALIAGTAALLARRRRTTG